MEKNPNVVIVEDINFLITILHNPEYVDCYTILINDGNVCECFTASNNPEMPNGVGCYNGKVVIYPDMEKKYAHFGKPKSIEEIEEPVKVYINNILSKWNND